MDKSLSKKERKRLLREQKLKEKEVEQLMITSKQTPIGKEQPKSTGQKWAPINSSKSTPAQPPQKQNEKMPEQQKKQDKTKLSQKKKKKQQEVSSEESGSGDDEDLDFNRVLQDQEQMDFSFSIAEINEKHYHSLKTILEKFARLTGVISSDWADAIVSNRAAGNVVIAEEADEDEQDEDEEDEEEGEDEDENVCSGVVNILAANQKLTKKVCNKISQSIQSQAIRGKKKPAELAQILNGNSCSLLVCERAINLPAFIVKSMHEVLAGEMSDLRKKNSSEYSKICGKYILGVSEVQIDKPQTKSKSKEGSSNRPEDANIEHLIFSRFEDYLFVEKSLGWWVGQSSPNAARKVPLYRLFFIISTDSYFEAVSEIETLLEDN